MTGRAGGVPARPRARRRWAAALMLALLPAACAAPPPAPPAPPLPYPPSARERMLRIALEEWREWGRIVVEPGERRPPAVPPEGVLLNFPRVLAYWRAVEPAEADGAVARNRARYGAALLHPESAAGLWAEPAWSAAFISYVMRGAGVDRREFPASAAHSFYLDGLLADAVRFPEAAPFVPRDWATYAPRPGDLLCADRSADPLPRWQDRLAEAGRFRPMHCDIVVAAPPGMVEAVGGNVADAVTLSRFPVDGAGRLLARQPGGPTWFAVFENRLGRLPPWIWSPAS